MKNFSIIGGGLVGSLMSILLKRKGHEVSIYEKRSDIREVKAAAGRSINLVVTRKGLRALEKASLLEEVLKITTPVFGRMMHSLEGELTYQPYGKDESECNYSVSRLRINQLMLDLAEKEGVKIHFEYSLKSISEDSNELSFSTKQGEVKVSSSIIIGADGANSATRKELTRILESQGTKVIDFQEPLGASYKEMLMPKGKSGEYLMEKNALHIWPRGPHMLMALPNLDGSFTMTLYMEDDGEVSFSQMNHPEKVKNLFETYYKDSTTLMPDYLDDFASRPEGNLATVRCDHWVLKDKIALIGDAAHGVVPFFGQGMNAGFDDCSLLVDLMETHGEDFDKIFSEYEKTQVKNGHAIADMAIENFTVMKEKVGDIRYLKRKKIEHELEKAFPEKFKSRYGLVVYTDMPYHECLLQGIENDKVIDQLMEDETLDLEKAALLLSKSSTASL